MLSSAVNRARAARKNESGFTLIELLIVIVILGILAAVVVFSVRGITDRGDTSACKAEVSTVETAIEAFYANSDPAAYPGTVGALVTAGYLRQNPSGASAITAATTISATGALPAAALACP